MKLARLGEPGREVPAILDENQDQEVYRDLSSVVSDINGDSLQDMSWADGLEMDSLPVLPDDMRIGPCVGNVGKIICTGLNYREHAKETNSPIPLDPILFSKAITSICGPNDDVIIPKTSKMTDWEIELAIVIGKETRHIKDVEVIDHVAGYCIANDVSEREFQSQHGGQWIKGKSSENFAPIGPWLVTKDEIPEPGNLDMKLTLDSKTMQEANTSDMIFSIQKLVSYIAFYMKLMPGDIIMTGTPSGVGFGRKPQKFLRPGEEIQLWIDGLGVQTQRVLTWRQYKKDGRGPKLVTGSSDPRRDYV